MSTEIDLNKNEVSAYFDSLAPTWDEHLHTNDEKIGYILDSAGIGVGSIVLDVACGTGVLFPYYEKRNVARVIGVDISEEMAKLATQKSQTMPNIEVLHADICTLAPIASCTSCVVYNAMPHFADHEKLLAALSKWLCPGGKLVIAHSMSLQALARCHSGTAAGVSYNMPEAKELAALMEPWFVPEQALSTQDMYLVSAVRKK